MGDAWSNLPAPIPSPGSCTGAWMVKMSMLSVVSRLAAVLTGNAKVLGVLLKYGHVLYLMASSLWRERLRSPNSVT